MKEVDKTSVVWALIDDGKLASQIARLYALEVNTKSKICGGIPIFFNLKGKQKLVWKIAQLEKSETKLQCSADGKRNDFWLEKTQGFCLYTAKTYFRNTHDSSPSLMTNEPSQSSLKLDFTLFRLAAADGFLRPFSEPDLPSGILDFWGSRFSVDEFCNNINQYL